MQLPTVDQGKGGVPQLQVFASSGQKAVLPHLIPEFERNAQCKVVVTYGSADGIKGRVARGEAADVYIGNAAIIDELSVAGSIAAGSVRELVRGSIGVAVRSGARKPDISTVDAFRQALLDAGSVAYAEIGASGVHFAGLIQQLGIEAQVKAKALTLPDGLIGQLVADGKAELVVQHLSELKAVQGIDIVGPLPAPLQKEIILRIGAGVSRRAEATALIDFLTGAATTSVFEANGYSR